MNARGVVERRVVGKGRAAGGGALSELQVITGTRVHCACMLSQVAELHLRLSESESRVVRLGDDLRWGAVCVCVCVCCGDAWAMQVRHWSWGRQLAATAHLDLLTANVPACLRAPRRRSAAGIKSAGLRLKMDVEWV